MVKKQDEKNAADADVTKAQSALDDANAKLDAAKKDAENNAEAISNAQTQLDAANKALSDAQAKQETATGTLTDATSAEKAASDAYTKAQDALATAQSKADEAKAAADAAQQAYDAALAGHGTHSTPFDETDAGKAAAQAVTDAQTAVDQANSTLASAKNTLDAANAALAKALAGTDVTQAMIDAIDSDDTLANSSYGFFEWLNNIAGDSNKNALALKFLTDSSWTGNETRNGSTVGTFLSYTHIGQEDDATSLTNLGNAIKLVAASNQYRANDNILTGRQPLKVSTLLMALAEINANWNGRDSSQASGHANQTGENTTLTAYGENQAAIGSTGKFYSQWTEYGYDASDGDDYGTDDGTVDWDTPYDAWYLGERYNYIHQNVLKDTNDTTKYHAFNNGVTGHYLNLMGWVHGGITGVAVSQYYDGTWYHSNAMQEFSFETAKVYNPNDPTGSGTVSGADLGVYDVDEFQKLYDQYVAALAARTATKQAQADVDTAQKAYDAANTAAQDAQSKLIAAQSAYDAAKSEYDSAIAAQNIDTAKAKLDAANDALATAQSELTAAQSDAATAKDALDKADATLTAAQQAKDAADAVVTSKQADVDAANAKLASIKGGTEVADAQKEVDSAQAALADAKKAASNADDALKAAQKTAEDAKAQLEDAQAKLAEANAKAADAKQKALLADANWQAAESAYQDLKSRVDARDSAKSALDQAEAALKQAEADLAAARAALPDLQTQAKQYEDVANIIAQLPNSDEYLANPELLLDRSDTLQEYGKTEGLTDATKSSIERFCKLLNDAYALATEAKSLEPTIAQDQKTADDADAALASARADYDLSNQIYKQLAMSGKYGHTSTAANKAAQTPGKNLVPASVSTPKHMAAQSSLPKTGDSSMPFLPFGVAGAFAVLMGARQRRRED